MIRVSSRPVVRLQFHASLSERVRQYRSDVDAFAREVKALTAPLTFAQRQTRFGAALKRLSQTEEALNNALVGRLASAQKTPQTFLQAVNTMADAALRLDQRTL
jgi:hypothetical protein